MAEMQVGRYLFERLKQLGIKSIFGVPGDYQLATLDFIPQVGLKWQGNPNELNAGYAADGYARIHGAAAVVTTFGPGETSNMCPIAGAYCEFVPVAHIVGYPTEVAQNGVNIMHHSLGEVGDGKFDVFHQMSAHITCATAVIHDLSTAADEIDRCLNAMMYWSKPVYIGLPTDISLKNISSKNLETPLVTSLPPNDSALQSKVVKEISSLLHAAKNPVIIVDGGAPRNRFSELGQKLIEVASVPYFVTTMGKGAVGEHFPTFGGVYAGAGSYDGAKEAVESSDCLLWLGNYPSDFNTGEFTEKFDKEAMIDFQRFYIKIGDVKHDVKTIYLLEELISALSSKPLPAKKAVTWDPYPDSKITTKPDVLTQDYLWATLSHYFRNGDFIVSETGTSAFGIINSPLAHAPTARMYSQTVFGSIGFAAGSSVGAFLAGAESGLIKRPILITGEGSLQLTIQAFSDLIRHGCNPTIFLIFNDGYTIERLIHGRDAEYNTLPVWNYGMLWKGFAPPGFETKFHEVRTPAQLEKLLGDEEFCAARTPTLVQLYLDKYDAPKSVKLAAAAVEVINRAAAT